MCTSRKLAIRSAGPPKERGIAPSAMASHGLPSLATLRLGAELRAAEAKLADEEQVFFLLDVGSVRNVGENVMVSFYKFWRSRSRLGTTAAPSCTTRLASSTIFFQKCQVV